VSLQHGLVYYGGDGWTGKEDVWLAQQAAPQLTSRATRLAFDPGYETVLAVQSGRDRLGAAVKRMAADRAAIDVAADQRTSLRRVAS
jgi:transposase